MCGIFYDCLKHMNTLFPIDPVVPAGFKYIPDFISRDEENYLINIILNTELHTFNFQGFEAKRRVASFGYDWSFDKRILKKGKEIPASFQPVIVKVARQLSIKEESFAELLITEYPVGSVINWHRDAPPFGVIAGISLNTDCKFRLRPYEKSKQGRSSIISIPVMRRSLYVMQDDSRSGWEHSVAPVKDVRYSITLRTLNENVKGTN